jgi:hypothetical protein
MTDIRLLDSASSDTITALPVQVGERGGVNVYASYASLGGGTLNIYECPRADLKPNVPVYSSASGEPQHLNVAIESWLLGELVGSTSPSNVTLGVVTLGEDE